MTAERWQTVKSLFVEAVALDASEREAFLRSLKESDAEISLIVRELLEQPADQGPDLRNPCWAVDAAPPAPCALEPGRILIRRFEIKAFLGAGGLGEVYRAFDGQQGISVALKTLRPALAADPSAMAILRNELNTARCVTHPHACRLYDFHCSEDSDEPPFVTMELLDGETLAQHLQRLGALPFARALPLIEQVIDALEAAHQEGIVHRDLKAANIMLSEVGTRAVVMDFGLARAIKSGADLTTTLAGGYVAGTPAYMAPEQLRGERATFASDIHALGVVMFEMVTGRRPFEGATPIEIASRRLNEVAPSPRRFAPGLDRRWEYATIRCLSRAPQDRPASVRAVHALLNRQPPLLWLRRRAFVAGAISTPLLGAAGVVALMTARSAEVSIEVFDIENRSQDPELDYLCRGVTSEIKRRLSQIEHVTVIPARAVRSQPPSPQMAARLAIDGVLELANAEPRLSIRLEDSQTHSVIWSPAFDRIRSLTMLELQDAIATGAAAQLRRYLGQGPRWAGFAAPDASKSPTRSTTAFDLYLRGNSLLQEGSPESVRAAIEYFQRAVAEDSRFALAYASLAEAYLAIRNFGFTTDRNLAQLARENAERAVHEDVTLAEAQAVMAAVQQLDWDWAGSETSYNEALRLKPAFARARRWRAGLLLQFARYEEAIADMRRAFEQDPYDRSAISGHGLTYLFAGKDQEAIDFLERGIADREMPVARYNLCQAYAHAASLRSGDAAEALHQKALLQARTVAAIEQRSTIQESELSSRMFALAYSLSGDNAQAEPHLRRLEKTVAEQRTSPGFLAMIYAPQRRLSDALDAIDRAISLRDRFILYLRVNVFLDNVRGQPRFEAMLRTLRLK